MTRFCSHNYTYTQGYFYCTKCGKRTYGRSYKKRRSRKIGLGITGLAFVAIIGFLFMNGMLDLIQVTINENKLTDEIMDNKLLTPNQLKIASCSIDIKTKVQGKIDCANNGFLYFSILETRYPIEFFQIDNVDLFKQDDVYLIQYKDPQGEQVKHQIEQYQSGKTIAMNVYNALLNYYSTAGIIDKPAIQTEKEIPQNQPIETTTPKLELPEFEIKNPTEVFKPKFDPSKIENLIYQYTNEQRTRNGLAALANDASLASIARSHSEDMAANGYMSHTNLDGKDPSDRAASVGYSCYKDYGTYYTYGVAENIAQNWLYTSYMTSGIYTSYNWHTEESLAKEIVGGWMESPGHRQNILTSTYDRIGIGVGIASNDAVYSTQNFC
ncbi:MAG: CAP domain-containing protein [Thaumarchaeota archaeon]|nr:CAP domain-containing protein [Nitrososphaerota archaeon]